MPSPEANMNHKRRLHDAIVGVVITAGVALGYYVSAQWLVLPAVIGLTLIQSGFTGFCPVYFALDRLLPSEGGADSALLRKVGARLAWSGVIAGRERLRIERGLYLPLANFDQGDATNFTNLHSEQY
jgi:hypothetical protein